MFECMQEVSRLLSTKDLTSMPYHPICNGFGWEMEWKAEVHATDTAIVAVTGVVHQDVDPELGMDYSNLDYLECLIYVTGQRGTLEEF